MSREIKRKCEHCGKTIKRINNDWKSREYHKKCYKEIEEMKSMIMNMEKYKKVYNL